MSRQILVMAVSGILGIISTFLLFIIKESTGSGILGPWQTCGNETTGFNTVFHDVAPKFMKARAKCSEDFKCKSEPNITKCTSSCRNQCAFGNITQVIDEDGKFHNDQVVEVMKNFSEFKKKEELSTEFKECGTKGEFKYENKCSTFDTFFKCVIAKYEDICNKD